MATYRQEIILSTRTNGQLTALQQATMNKVLSEEWGIIEGGSNLQVRKSGSTIYVDRGYAYVGGHLVECEGTAFDVSGSSYYDVYLEITLNENYTGIAEVVVNSVSNTSNKWYTFSQNNGKLLRLQLGIVTSSNNTVEKLVNNTKKVSELVQEIDTLKFDSGWLTHSTSSYYFDYNYFRYRKVGKVVEISILATAKISVPNTERDFVNGNTIPVAFRPTYQIYGVARTNNIKIGSATVKTNGGITIQFADAIAVGDFVAFNATYTVD